MIPPIAAMRLLIIPTANTKGSLILPNCMAIINGMSGDCWRDLISEAIAPTRIIFLLVLLGLTAVH